VGIFNKQKKFGVFHGLRTNDTSDEYIGQIGEIAIKGDLIPHLEKQKDYLKISDKKITDDMNKIELTGDDVGFYVYPTEQLKKETIGSFRIEKSDVKFIPESIGGKGWEKGNFNCLQMINIEVPNQALIVGNYMAIKFFIQYIDLDEDEYDLIKDFMKKLKKIEDKNLKSNYLEIKKNLQKGLFETEKRKKFPVNRFNQYLSFQETQ